jgi:hypothetical protein
MTLQSVADSLENEEVEQLSLTASVPRVCERFTRRYIPYRIQQHLQSMGKAVSGANAVAKLLSDDRRLASLAKDCTGFAYDPLDPVMVEGLHFALSCLLEEINGDLDSLEVGLDCRAEWEKTNSPR